MFKGYQLKWCFTLAGILAVSTLLLRKADVQHIGFWEYIDYIFRLFSSIFICWFVLAFLLLRKYSGFFDSYKYIFSIAAATLVCMVLSYIMISLLPATSLNHEPPLELNFSNLLVYLSRGFLESIICFIVFNNVHTNAALQKSRLENEFLEQAHLRAQLLSLQQQISPHFLFNSLSTLKTIAQDYDTKNYIVQLANVYRYLLNFNQHHLTRLKDELAFIKSYLYIMDQRFEEALRVKLDVADDCLDLLIPPLSLQLLVENAIKHNMISPDMPLHISIKTNNMPALIVENNFQPKKTPEDSTGMGLQNIRERYKLLIDKPIYVENEGGLFTVTLPLLKK